MPLHSHPPPPPTAASVAHHVRPPPQQPRHVNPSSVARTAAELLSNASAAMVGQQQQPMVVVAGGGAVTGGSGAGVFGRNGLNVVVPGPAPHPHGPLIRGNFVPRLLAPLQAGGGFSSGGAGGSLPLYAIVKPQSQPQHQQQPHRPIVGGPPVHVCVPVGGGAPHCPPPVKLGPGNTLSLSLLCSGRRVEWRVSSVTLLLLGFFLLPCPSLPSYVVDLCCVLLAHVIVEESGGRQTMRRIGCLPIFIHPHFQSQLVFLFLCALSTDNNIPMAID